MKPLSNSLVLLAPWVAFYRAFFEIGAVPGCNSITNSMSLSGDIPDKSSGKTSAYSHTTGISSNLDVLMVNAEELVHSV